MKVEKNQKQKWYTLVRHLSKKVVKPSYLREVCFVCLLFIYFVFWFLGSKLIIAVFCLQECEITQPVEYKQNTDGSSKVHDAHPNTSLAQDPFQNMRSPNKRGYGEGFFSSQKRAVKKGVNYDTDSDEENQPPVKKLKAAVAPKVTFKVVAGRNEADMQRCAPDEFTHRFPTDIPTLKIEPRMDDDPAA